MDRMPRDVSAEDWLKSEERVELITGRCLSHGRSNAQYELMRLGNELERVRYAVQVLAFARPQD